MRQSDVQAVLNGCRADLETLCNGFADSVDRVRDWVSAGIASGASGASGGHTGASPTERAALGQRDAFSKELGDAYSDLESLRLTLRRLVAFQLRHTPVAEVFPELTEGCVSCKRVGVWSPITDVAPGQRLCRFCYDFRSSEGRLPWPAILEKHHQGRRITRSDIERSA